MLKIVVECKPDEALVRALGITKKEVTHQPSKGGVLKFLEKNPEVIGIVDEDPGSANPKYFYRFKKDAQETFFIDSYSINKRGTKLIVLKPRLEEWILNQAKSVNINPNDYSLPKDGHALHKIINTRIPKFQQMLEEMIRRECEGLKYMHTLIRK